MKVYIAQINVTLGEFSNKKIINHWKKADEQKADIIVFPELTVCGYNPQDFALRDDFIEKNNEAIKELLEYSNKLETAAVIGAISKRDHKRYNTAFVIHKGKIIHTHYKVSLPNYGIFDEKRLFSPGNVISTFEFKGKNICILICEDVWVADNYKSLKYSADYIISINASPFSINKHKRRIDTIGALVRKCKVPLVYVNLVGGQDNAVYDGGSMIFNSKGRVTHQLPFFEEVGVIPDDNFCAIGQEDILLHIYNALKLALKDYVCKNGFTDVVISYSGGIDSTLVTVLAIDTLGRDKVHLVTLPSKYTSYETSRDIDNFLKNIGKGVISEGIDDIHKLVLQKLDVNENSVTSENIQARIRSILVMSLSNKFGYLPISTTNKSELSVGYTTLYGDMSGGFALIKDLYKTKVYKLAKWINIQKNSVCIPEGIINKVPSAELRHNQTDQDDLPSYKVLDRILYKYIEQQLSENAIISQGFDDKIVKKVIFMIKKAEHKRYQAPLGPKITRMSFDFNWRYPITNKFL